MSKNYHMMVRDGVYYYNRRIPNDLVGQLDDPRISGGTYIRFSLKTKDQGEAIKQRDIREVEWSAKFDAARSGLPQPIGRGEAHRLIWEYVRREDAKWTASESKEAWTAAERRERKLDLQLSECAIAGRDTLESDVEISETFERITEEFHVKPNEKTLTEIEFFNLVQKAILELYRRAIRRSDLDFSVGAIDSFFSEQLKPKPTVGEIAEDFLKIREEEAKARGEIPKSTQQFRTRLYAARAFFGDGSSIDSINYEACENYRAFLQTIPAHRAKYKNLTLFEEIKACEKAGDAKIGHKTQAEYLSALTRFLRYAAKREFISTAFSEGMKPMSKKPSEAGKRKPFSDGQIAAFFQSSYYADCSAKSDVPYSVADYSWRFWLPLIVCLNGMRPKEVCQMFLKDIKKTDQGTYYFDILSTDDEEDEEEVKLGIVVFEQTTKNESSKRKIPIHPELLAIGIVQYRDELLASGKLQFFPEITPNPKGNPSDYPLKRFREAYLWKGMERKSRQTFYSFRHSFRDALRKLDANDDTLLALGGWSSNKSVSSNYGEISQPDFQIEFVERIGFHGLDLSHLHIKK